MSALAALTGYGSDSDDGSADRADGGDTAQPEPREPASRLGAMLPPPKRAKPIPSAATVSARPAIGLHDLLRRTETPVPGASGARRPDARAQHAELPPGFFDEEPAGSAPAGPGIATGQAVAGGGGSGLNRSLLAMLPPPSHGSIGGGLAAARADQPVARAPQTAAPRAPLPPPTRALRGSPPDSPEWQGASAAAGQHPAQQEDEEDEGVTAPYGEVTAPYPGAEADEDDDGVTAPYGDSPYGGGGGGGGWANSGAGAAAHGGGGAAPPRLPPGIAAAGSAPPDGGGSLPVPLELLSRAERRAMEEACAASGAAAMPSVRQEEMTARYRGAPAVLAPKPAADVHVEGRVFNRSTGAAETTAKPTGTQKRKHQINHLAFQYQQSAAQLEQRGRSGLKSKAETYGKYGW